MPSFQTVLARMEFMVITGVETFLPTEQKPSRVVAISSLCPLGKFSKSLYNHLNYREPWPTQQIWHNRGNKSKHENGVVLRTQKHINWFTY